MNQLLNALRLFRLEVKSSDTTSLSYYLLLSVVPSLTLVVIILNWLHLDVVKFENILLQFFSDDVTAQLIAFMQQKEVSYISIFTIIMCLLISSRGIFKMKQVSDRLYGFSNKQTLYVKSRFNAVVNTLFFLLIVVFLVLLIGFLPGVGFVISTLSLVPFSRYIFTFLAVLGLMLLINLIIPSDLPRLIDVYIGSLVSTIGIMALLIFYEAFFNISTYTNLYGPLASIAAVLIILNWMSNVIYFGISLSAVRHRRYMERKGSQWSKKQ